MTHYNINPGICEVNIFKPSGKWYTTIAVDMTKFYDELNGFEIALLEEIGVRYMNEDDDWIFVCNNPYLKNEYPRLTRSSTLRAFKKNNE